MDAFQLLEEARDVVLADEATIDAAVDLVLTAAFADTGPSRVGSVPKHRRRRLVVGGTVLAVIAAGALVADLVAPFGSGRGGTVPSPRGPQRSTTVPIRPGGGRDSSAVLAASTVRRIAAASTAVANSGTAVVTETTSTGTPPVTQTMTTDVTFSGTNVNYTIATDSAGAQGVENRYVGGQLYLYVKGPDLQMHWYHTLDPGTHSSTPGPSSTPSARRPASRSWASRQWTAKSSPICRRRPQARLRHWGSRTPQAR